MRHRLHHEVNGGAKPLKRINSINKNLKQSRGKIRNRVLCAEWPISPLSKWPIWLVTKACKNHIWYLPIFSMNCYTMTVPSWLTYNAQYQTIICYHCEIGVINPGLMRHLKDHHPMILARQRQQITTMMHRHQLILTDYLILPKVPPRHDALISP